MHVEIPDPHEVLVPRVPMWETLSVAEWPGVQAARSTFASGWAILAPFLHREVALEESWPYAGTRLTP